MEANKFKPIACKNVMVGNPNNIGINQFHNNIKGNPKIIPTSRIVPKNIATPAKTSFIIFSFKIVLQIYKLISSCTSFSLLIFVFFESVMKILSKASNNKGFGSSTVK